ncbi:MAG TPA: class I SAM-dependent methyltransferase [Burkholderiales bacterium]|nr:class I SAM-dependent methyltransferase [Burkholderiales bacterium]
MSASREAADDADHFVAMPSLPVLKTALRELVTQERVPRRPEPDLVMDHPQKVAAFTRAGREDGVMAPVYLFHCAQICDVVRAGDVVLDLGCGPATQLAMAARLNPDVRFIGVDLSDEMLERAHRHVADLRLPNVSFERSDVADLSFVADGSVNAVVSTVALHHVPDVAHLERTFAEIARVLAPSGGVYVVDFGRLRSEKSIEYFAYQYRDRQPELFTLDYLYSLRAAFGLDDFKRSAEHLAGRARVHSTFAMPFMVAVKSPSRAMDSDRLRKALREIRKAMPAHHQRDLRDLRTFFRLGGLGSALLG